MSSLNQSPPQLPAGSSNAGYPPGAIPWQISSGNVANATATATSPATAGLRTYIAGMLITPGGATAAALVTATIIGLIGGTNAVFIVGAPLGVAVMGLPTFASFSPAIPANAVNTAIVVTCPALGSGNTNNSIMAWGYQL